MLYLIVILLFRFRCITSKSSGLYIQCLLSDGGVFLSDNMSLFKYFILAEDMKTQAMQSDQ